MDDTHSGVQRDTDKMSDGVQAYPPDFAARSEMALGSVDDRPPLLQYDIASKKRSIAIQWAIILSFNAFIPIILYFGLRAGTRLSKKSLINLAQVTTIASVFTWPHRLYKLLRNNGERAPRDRTSLTWDTFQWSFLINIPIVTAFCVISSIQESLRYLAIGPVVVFGTAGLQCIISCWMCSAGVRTFCRLSSMPAGSVMRPAVYSVIEDVTAVDGGAGQEYRLRLNERYVASPPFRRIVYNISLYLGIAFLAQTGIQVVVLVTTSDEVSYLVSTGVLWVFAGFSACCGIFYTRMALRDERLWWKRRVLEKNWNPA